MEVKDITLILINVLLIIVIICVYVHTAQVMKDGYTKIEVLTNTMKEGMSAAQRYGLAGMYVGKKSNLLMQSDKQTVEPHNVYPLITSSRGNMDVSSLYKPKITSEGSEVSKTSATEVAQNIGIDTVTAIQNGAASTAAVTDLKPTSSVETDETQFVEVQQNGIIDNTTSEKFWGTNNRVQPLGIFTTTSKGTSIIGDKINGINSSQ